VCRLHSSGKQFGSFSLFGSSGAYRLNRSGASIEPCHGCPLRLMVSYTLKNDGLFQPKFGLNMDKPKCWVKNVIKKFTVESES